MELVNSCVVVVDVSGKRREQRYSYWHSGMVSVFGTRQYH